MTADQKIDYEALAQDAMRGVVRTVLTKAAKTGLPGDHHFYISFDTHGQGVALSKRLKEKYPSEMTIVLQHRFWDLVVSDDRFEVKLTFDGIPERLVVPFTAIKVFFDPSVRYGLQFGEGEVESDQEPEPRDRVPGGPRTGVTRSPSRKPRAPARKTRPEAEQDTSPPLPASGSVPATKGTTPASIAPQKPNPAPAAPASEDKPSTPASAEIVSLDKFRKK